MFREQGIGTRLTDLGHRDKVLCEPGEWLGVVADAQSK